MDDSLVTTSSSIPAIFSNCDRLSVRQRKRWMEILFSWESKNTYLVYEGDNPIFEVQEQGRGIAKLLRRLLLRTLRPFTAHVEMLSTNKTALVLKRPFRFFFHRLEARDGEGTLIGAIQRKWTWLRRKYIVEGPGGEEIATLFGPILRPWTFEVRLPGSEVTVGLVQKKWSGLAKELFTEADNFWVEMSQIEDTNLRALLFSATILIDIVHFERKN